MENLSGNMESQLENQAKGNKREKKSRWQILLVDDHGKMITIKWFTPISIAVICALFLSIVLCITLAALFQSTSSDNRKYTAEIETYKGQIEAMRTEKDILMAKLVVAESKLSRMEKKDDASKKQKNNSSALKKKKSSKPEKVPLPPKKQIITDKDKEKPGETGLKQNTSEDSGKTNGDQDVINGVEIDNLVFSHESKTDLLRTKFVIKNTSSSPEAVSGYIFIILKPDNSESKDWFTIPSVGLTSGIPAFPKRGQYFKIQRFKTVNFKTTRQKHPELFKKATIFVFDENDDLMLRKTFPVSIERT